MKKTLVSLLAVSAIVLGGCSKPTPSPVPSASVRPSASPTAGVTTTPTTTAVPTTQAPDPTEGTGGAPGKTVAPTTSAAVPPAIEFAQRWGAKYPSVPEFAILKSANATCKLISASGVNWNDNTDTMSAIETVIGAAGINKTDALEFAQDANQNYCSSVSNPT